MNASSVSGALRRAGFRPVSPSDRRRQGLRCTSAGLLGDRVRVCADLDNATEAEALSLDAEQTLVGLGYQVTRASEDTVYVSELR